MKCLAGRASNMGASTCSANRAIAQSTHRLHVANPASRAAERRRLRVPAALPEWLRSLADFDSWAPRSSRIWRLQQWEPETARQSADEVDQGTPLASLHERINQLRNEQEATTMDSNEDDEAAGVAAGAGEDIPIVPFSGANDADISAALLRRMDALASAATLTSSAEVGDDTIPGPSSSIDHHMADSLCPRHARATPGNEPPLTGEEIRGLLINKYSREYDMSFVRRDLPGMPPQVALNVMWLYRGQRSFKMSDTQYLEKLDSVAALLDRLGQSQKVREFLSRPARSEKGLPRRPVVGTAISIRLDLEPSQVQEWFGQGDGLHATPPHAGAHAPEGRSAQA